MNEIVANRGNIEKEYKMRVEPKLTYQDYKDGVTDAFHTLDMGMCQTAEEVTNCMADEDDELLIEDSTSLALWIISIGEYEIRHNLLEERVEAQLCYHIPEFLKGTYTEDLTVEEYQQVKVDVDYILSKIQLVPVVVDEEYMKSFEE